MPDFLQSINAATVRRFFYALSSICLLGCNSDQVSVPEIACDAETVFVGEVQGASSQSPFINATVQVQGVVTRAYAGHGFYIQEASENSDGDSSTSDALWVELLSETLPVEGDWVVVSGVVNEQDTNASANTTITILTQPQWLRCNQNVDIPVIDAGFDLAVEAYEHMRVRLSQWRVINSNQSNGVLIASESLYIPTQVVSPGQAAKQLAERNARRSLVLQTPSRPQRLIAGDVLNPVTGIISAEDDVIVLSSDAFAGVNKAVVIPDLPTTAATQNLRVVSINVANLFNGDGQGSGFPTARGAQTFSQYQQQLAHLVAAMQAMQADIFALMEIENDGYGEHSTIAQLAAALSNSSAAAWTFIQPGGDRLGDDAIAIGILYKPARIAPRGEAVTLTQRPFDGLSRVPLAQRFQATDSDLSFWLAVNHFKSKGGCPKGNGQNADQSDGQGCWNEVRQRSARVVSDWLKALQADSLEPNALLVGDLNSYRMEDPIRELVQAGWFDVVGQHASPPLFSYRYQGAVGTLDYAFASKTFIKRIDAADIWHINSYGPGSDTREGLQGFSDHDPVIVDIRR